MSASVLGASEERTRAHFLETLFSSTVAVLALLYSAADKMSALHFCLVFNELTHGSNLTTHK